MSEETINSSGHDQEYFPATPLAERIRPQTLEQFIGQEKILGKKAVLRSMIKQDKLSSVIFWGPPGSGKTTLARLIASTTSAGFVAFSAVTSGVKDVRRIIDEAALLRKMEGRRTILFVDELHRFNKAQQDAFLPAVENGTVILIGATTENPSFEVNMPLLSRSKVFVFTPLSTDNIVEILTRALNDTERGLGSFNAEMPVELLRKIGEICDGDARIALNTLELAVLTCKPDSAGIRRIDSDHLAETLGSKSVAYDKFGEEHYNIISALHKSMRNSDPDAALYWLGRMLEAGEDPQYVARRIVRFASEDVGMADPRALQMAIAAQQAVHFIGMPEGNLALSQAVVYMATAPKSNALYSAYKEVQKDIQNSRDEPVPMALRNSVTGLMRDVGYGLGYKYAHEYPEAVTDLECLPASLAGKTYYKPSNRGFEKTVRERMDFLKGLRKEFSRQESSLKQKPKKESKEKGEK